jgi:hypothetical protein
VVDDVAGAVAALRAHGARRVALVGASLLGGSSTGLHGWDLLGGTNGATFTPFAAEVASFVSVRTRS